MRHVLRPVSLAMVACLAGVTAVAAFAEPVAPTAGEAAGARSSGAATKTAGETAGAQPAGHAAETGMSGMGSQQAAAGANPRAFTVGPCPGQPDTLGVSRVVEIDTTGGPGFGEQYKGLKWGHDFLEPGEVVLTFDDGPLRHHTAKVLAALDGECTRATFFSVGKMALADPEMVREIDRRGHTVGTHTWSHRNLRSSAPASAVGEVELGVSAVSMALGRPVAPFFRFPYLADSKGMIGHDQSRDLAMFSIDVDSKDYRTRDPRSVHQRVLAGLKAQGKGIILFHDIQPSTAGALPGLLEAIRKQGYKVVHLVSKAAATTMPEYDTVAEREMARKSKALAANPLANRSMTWANSSTEASEAATARPSKKKGHKTAAVDAQKRQAQQPQQAAQPANNPPPPAPPRRPARTGASEEIWWNSIFGE